MLQKQIQEALIESGMTQHAVAEKIGVDRSVINRRLKGKANLTARSVAEFAYALDKEVLTTFFDKPMILHANIPVTTSKLDPSTNERLPQVTYGTSAPSPSVKLKRVSL
jgi:transcriptional regulator with XRE-family HTH domain